MIITNIFRVLITLIFNVFFINFSANTTSIFTSDYNNNNNTNNNDDRTILLNEIQLKNLINLNTKNIYSFSINNNINNNNSRNNISNNYNYNNNNNNKISSRNKNRNSNNSNSNNSNSGEYNNRTGKFYFDAIFRIGSDFGNFFDYNDGDDDVDYDQSSNVKVCDCECGTSNEQNRIVGGIPTGVNQFPWMARLVYDGKFHCGGTLLTKDYVLTAAHCVKRLRRSKIRIILGDHDQYITTESKAIQRAVTSIVKHRKFDPNTYNNDIALLRLRKPVVFSKIIKPVCLPKANYDPAGKVATVVGWGRTSEGGELPSTVNHVKVQILSLNECRNKKYKSTRITTSMLCAGGSRMDSCQGDSGGPLLLSSGYKYHVVGIVSWGVGCGREGYPGVYTRVPKFVPWIKANLDNTCLCQ